MSKRESRWKQSCCSLKWVVKYVKLNEPQQGTFYIDFIRGADTGRINERTVDENNMIPFKKRIHTTCTLFHRHHGKKIKEKYLSIILRTAAGKCYAKVDVEVSRYLKEPTLKPIEIAMETKHKAVPYLVGKFEFENVDTSPPETDPEKNEKCVIAEDEWDLPGEITPIVGDRIRVVDAPDDDEESVTSAVSSRKRHKHRKDKEKKKEEGEGEVQAPEEEASSVSEDRSSKSGRHKRRHRKKQKMLRGDITKSQQSQRKTSFQSQCGTTQASTPI